MRVRKCYRGAGLRLRKEHIAQYSGLQHCESESYGSGVPVSDAGRPFSPFIIFPAFDCKQTNKQTSKLQRAMHCLFT